MLRKLLAHIGRFGFIPPVAILLLALGFGLASLWRSDGAAGGAIEYRLCNLVLPAPPDKFSVATAVVGERMAMLVGAKKKHEAVDPQTSQKKFLRSGATIDPSGQITAENYALAEEAALVRPVLARRQIKPFDPANAPWPYTENTQLPAEWSAEQVISWRSPDPGAGLALGFERGLLADGFTESLIIKNCRSEAVIVVEVRLQDGQLLPGQPEKWVWNVSPEDEQAFQTFFNSMEVKGGY